MPPKQDDTAHKQDAAAPKPDNAGAAGGTTGAAGGATGGNVPPPGTQGTGAKNKDKLRAPGTTFGTPPPPLHVLQLTPELFQQTVAAAVTAALNAQRGQQPAPAAVADTPPAAAVVLRKEKKLAEFWTSRPTMWFRLFDGQFPESLGEDFRFNSLLNHLPSAALPFVDHVLRAPGVDPFTRSKASLCLLYTSPSPRDGLLSRMPSSA